MDPAAAAEVNERPADLDAFAVARAALDQAVRVAEAALALLRAELRLARSSALMLIWLGFALVFLGVGAWLATSAAMAAGIYELTGNIFYGIGSVALANLIGVAIVLLAMRGCWRDLSLPRTRRAISRIGHGNE
jgi:hypothetical protein